MAVTIDVSELAGRLAALHHGGRPTSVAVVVPLAEGLCDVVREFLDEGPPFDPAAIGLDRHQVYVTDREAIFVFETEAGVQALERILAEPDFWDVVSAWEHCASEEPRVAAAVFEWPERLHGPRHES